MDKQKMYEIGDRRIKFYFHNTVLLPPMPKSSLRHLK